MSNLLYPSIGNLTVPGSPVYPPDLPGITLNVVRAPVFNTGVQQALSGVESRIGYQLYPMLEWTLEYEFLRDSQTAASELRTLTSFFNQMAGQADSFLFNDPWFNSVTLNAFAQTDGATTAFQLTALYTNSQGSFAGIGRPEIVQNLNGPPLVYIDRYELNELLSPIARTNIIPRSEAFAVGWTLTNATVVGNTTVAPDGNTTADSLFETTSTTQHHAQYNSLAVSGAVQPFSFSVFLKPGLTRTWAQLQLFEGIGSTAASAYFNLSGAGSLGTIGTGTNWSGVTASITPCVGGWYRCTVSGQNTNSATSMVTNINIATGNNVNSYTGVITDGLIVWGAQLEIGAVPTMYLQTNGTAVTQTDYTMGVAGVVNTQVTFPGGATLLWSGQFYYRARFTDDTLEFAQMKDIVNVWEMKKVKLRQIKL